MKKKSPKTKKTAEPALPSNRQSEFYELVDRFMDKHNLPANEARKKAFSEMGLSEGFKRTLRKMKKRSAPHARETVEKEIMRQGARRGRKQYELETAEKYLNPQEAEDVKFSSDTHAANIALMALKAVPVPSPSARIKARERVGLDVEREQLRELGRKAANKAFAVGAAEDIYQEQPVVKAAEEKEKSNWLKKILRMRDLGLA